jgi:hypothetical protein
MGVRGLFGIITLISPSLALACGSGVGQIKPGDKVVGIQMNPFMDRGKPAKWAMDDDGLLVIGLVASACYEEIPDSSVTLTSEQSDCVDKAYQDPDSGISYSDRIEFYGYNPEYEQRTKAQALLKNKCGIDAIALLKASEAKVDNMNLPCADDLQKAYRLVNKAANRNQEYVEEQLKSDYAKSLASEELKDYKQHLGFELRTSQGLKELFSSTPVKMGKFKKWLEDFRAVVRGKSYQVVESPDSQFDPDKQNSLGSILMDFGSKALGMYSMCGPAFPKDIVDRLSSVIWQPRGSEPGTQGGSGSAKQRAQ